MFAYTTRLTQQAWGYSVGTQSEIAVGLHEIMMPAQLLTCQAILLIKQLRAASLSQCALDSSKHKLA